MSIEDLEKGNYQGYPQWRKDEFRSQKEIVSTLTGGSGEYENAEMVSVVLANL